MGCVSSKNTDIVTNKEATELKNKSESTKDASKSTLPHSNLTTVNKEIGSLTQKDDSSIFDINVSSRTIDTLGIIKLTDDVASTASLKSFPIDERTNSEKKRREITKVIETEETDTSDNISIPSIAVSQSSSKPALIDISNVNSNNNTIEDILAVGLVDQVLGNLQESMPIIEKDISNPPDIIVTPEDESGDKTKENVEVKIKDKTLTDTNIPITPIPSAQCSTIVDKLTPKLRLVCAATNFNRVLEVSEDAHKIILERSLSLYKQKNPILFQIMEKMSNIDTLDFSGLYFGPVCIRAVLLSLMNDKKVTTLNLADNMMDSDCSDLLGEMLYHNKTIKHINLCSNMLGKESLSKSLGKAIQANCTIESIDISSCGASSFHAICESLRMNKDVVLRDINFCHNVISDEQQLSIDISLLLESKNCLITDINLTGNGIKSSGMDIIAKCLISNKSLKIFKCGGNTVKNTTTIANFIIASATHPVLEILDLDQSIVEENSNGEHQELFDIKTDLPVSSLIELHLFGCGLTDEMTNKLINLNNKLCNLQLLDLSCNNNLSKTGFEKFVRFTEDIQGSSSLSTLLFEGNNNLDVIKYSINYSLPSLSVLSLKKSKLTAEIVDQWNKSPISLDDIKLDGIRLGRSDMLNQLLKLPLFENISIISLSNCGFMDQDVKPIVSSLSKLNPPWNLRQLNLSINRITNGFVNSLVEALLKHKEHTLTSLDLSNNQISDSGFKDLSKLYVSTFHITKLRSINLSNNQLTCKSVAEFLSSLSICDDEFPLSVLDIRNQSNGGSNEDDMDEVAEVIANLLSLSTNNTDKLSNLPNIKNKFTLHLSNLGGGSSSKFNFIDSIAIKTDLGKLKKMSGCLRDSLQIYASLTGHYTMTDENNEIRAVFSLDEWKKIIGQDSPKWIQVTSNVEKSVFLSNMPATVTYQRLEGLLEMEADCNIKDIYLLKDSIIRKPTGAAWVLFEDKESVSRAVEWFISGGAQMYGTPFSISSIPCLITDDAGVKTIAKKELEAREKLQKREREADRNLLEQSEQLASERAAYREAHPAYTNGRIS